MDDGGGGEAADEGVGQVDRYKPQSQDSEDRLEKIEKYTNLKNNLSIETNVGCWEINVKVV